MLRTCTHAVCVGRSRCMEVSALDHLALALKFVDAAKACELIRELDHYKPAAGRLTREVF